MGLKPILAAGLAAGMAMFLFQAAIHATPYAHPGLESMAREGLSCRQESCTKVLRVH